jgi:hypothetical protein
LLLVLQVVMVCRSRERWEVYINTYSRKAIICHVLVK